MNTAVNFNPVNGANRGGRLAHVFRTHNLNKKRVSSEHEAHQHHTSGAITLQPFKEPKLVATVGTSKITKNLSVYKKRYEQALAKGDEKTAARNLTKIKELELQLHETKRKRRGREASMVESSWGITKFPPNKALEYDPKILQKMKDIALKIITDQFPYIDPTTIGVAGHIDQRSIHIHTVFDIPHDTTFTKMIANRRYTEFQQLWNKAIREEFSDLPIETITPKEESQKEYLPLAEYKRQQEEQSGGAEVNEKLKNENERLKDTLADVAVALENGNLTEAKEIVAKLDIGRAKERAKTRYEDKFKKRWVLKYKEKPKNDDEPMGHATPHEDHQKNKIVNGLENQIIDDEALNTQDHKLNNQGSTMVSKILNGLTDAVITKEDEEKAKFDELLEEVEAIGTTQTQDVNIKQKVEKFTKNKTGDLNLGKS